MTHFQNYFSGDPYVGLRTDEIKKKNERIVDLENEVRKLTQKVSQLESR